HRVKWFQPGLYLARLETNVIRRHFIRTAVMLLSLIALVAAVQTFHAGQTAQAGRLAALQEQIDRIFADRAYDTPRFGPARWLPDGTAYAIVERSGDESQIARYDAATGKRTVLATVKLDIDKYEWSADSKRLLIFTNTRKVWRQNTRGDYWLLDVADGALKK